MDNNDSIGSGRTLGRRMTRAAMAMPLGEIAPRRKPRIWWMRWMHSRKRAAEEGTRMTSIIQGNSAVVLTVIN